MDATYTVFTSADGTKYFQIDTFGSDSRVMRGKKSQSVQIDSKIAKQLVKLIIESM